MHPWIKVVVGDETKLRQPEVSRCGSELPVLQVARPGELGLWKWRGAHRSKEGCDWLLSFLEYYVWNDDSKRLGEQHADKIHCAPVKPRGPVTYRRERRVRK